MKKAASTTKRTTSKKPKTEGLGVIGELDRYLFGEGRHYQLYHKLGAHPYTYRGQDGYYFAVWAPHAAAVSLVGDFNAWNPDATPMKPVADSGIYELFVPGLGVGQLYKFAITTHTGTILFKADPYAFSAEYRPGTASVTADIRGFKWNDSKWMESRAGTDPVKAPISIYEVHLGSWKKKNRLALTNEDVKKELDGQVVFFAVPAEEYGEIEFKNSLTAQGKIRYGGGKCELIRIGAFDDIDLDIVHHTGDKDISIGSHSNNGFVSKVIRYKGLAAHAAGAPHLGVNALNAASLGLSALAYQRETFRDDDHVRIHPIITKGGNLVNVVPDEVVIETLVRAANKDAIADAAAKTDRAFKAGAIAAEISCINS